MKFIRDSTDFFFSGTVGIIKASNLSASANQKMQITEIKISACLLIVANLFILAAARDIDNGNQDTFQR
jgi:hypothetical protein